MLILVVVVYSEADDNDDDDTDDGGRDEMRVAMTRRRSTVISINPSYSECWLAGAGKEES